MNISHKFLALGFLFSLLAAPQTHAMQPGGGWKKPTVITALLATVGAVAYQIYVNIKEKHEIAASNEIRRFVDLLIGLEAFILSKPDHLFQSSTQIGLSTPVMLMGALSDAHYTQALGISQTLLLDDFNTISSQAFTKQLAVERALRHIFTGPAVIRIIGIWQTLNSETQEQLLTEMRTQQINELAFEIFSGRKHTV